MNMSALEIIQMLKHELQLSFNIKLEYSLWYCDSECMYYEVNIFYDKVKPPLRFTLYDMSTYDLTAFSQNLIKITKDLVENGAKYEYGVRGYV